MWAAVCSFHKYLLSPVQSQELRADNGMLQQHLQSRSLDRGNCENDKPEYCGYIHASVTLQEATNLANALATTTPGRLQHDGVANPVAAPQRLLYGVYTGLYKDKKGSLVANVAVALLPNWDL